MFGLGLIRSWTDNHFNTSGWMEVIGGSGFCISCNNSVFGQIWRCSILIKYGNLLNMHLHCYIQGFSQISCHSWPLIKEQIFYIWDKKYVPEHLFTFLEIQNLYFLIRILVNNMRNWFYSENTIICYVGPGLWPHWNS